MGVKNLWQLFHPKEYVTPKDTKLAIDTSAWLYQLNNTNILYNTYFRIIKLIHNSNKPYFIFDGHPSFLKKLTIEKRKELMKKNELNNFIKNIVNNRMCKCNKPFRECEHGSVKSEYHFNHLYKTVKNTLSNHNFNWGDDFYKSESFLKKSKVNKLNYLLKMRELRGYSLVNDEKDLQSFSLKQIEGVKQRNRVLEMINQIERNRIMSDCRKEFYFSKEKIESEEESELVFTDDEINHSNRNKEISEENEITFDEIKNVSKKEISNETESDKEIQNIEEIKEETDKNFKETLKDSEKIKEMTEGISKNLEEIYESQVNLEIIEPIELIEEVESTNPLESNEPIESSDSKESFTIKDHESTKKLINDINLMYISTLDTIKQIVSCFNLPIVQSIGESDVQLAYMNKTGIVDAVITDDNDVFVHGSKKIYRNFFTNAPTLHVNEYSQEYLIKLAYFIGCDYSLGVKNIGLKKAMKLVDTVKDEEIALLKEVYNDSSFTPVNDHKFSTSKTKIIDSFKRMGGSKEEAIRIKNLLDKCECEYLKE